MMSLMLNCTEVVFSSTTSYRTTQTIVLTVFLCIVILNNVLAIYATLKAKSTQKCLFCQLYNVSYLSNIIAALSLYGGGTILVSGSYSDVRHCQVIPKDRYFFFYFGVYNNIFVLLANTIFRRKSLTTPYGCILTTDTLRKLLIRYCIPILLTSSVLSFISIITQHYAMGSLYMETSLLTYSAPLLIAVIATNIHLTFYLNEKKKISEKMNSEQSWKNIEKARKMLLIITKLQTIYCMLWVTLIILLNTVGQRNEINSIVLVWLLRLVFGLSFVLEAKILIRRDRLVQKVILKGLRNLVTCSCSSKTNKPTDETSSDNSSGKNQTMST